MTITPVTAVLLFFFGSVWGSFFYTLAVRFIDGTMEASPQEALMGRSKCPHCGMTIKVLFLVPILGYIITRGRCASCLKRIHPAYPLAEIGYGLLMVLFAGHFGITSEAMAFYLIASLGITISIIDLKVMRIPDALLGIIFIISLYPLILAMEWKSPLGGMAVLGIIFVLILMVFPGSFGGGDLKYAMLIGLIVGFEQSFVVLEIALIAGAITGVIYGTVSGKGLKTKMPFGPFLTLGMITSMIYGQDIILMYYGLVR